MIFLKRKTPTERKMEEAAMRKKKVDNTKEKYEEGSFWKSGGKPLSG